MNSTPPLIYSFLSKIYYETIDLYDPSSELVDIACHALDKGWKISRGGFWTQCSPIGWRPLNHGWKIHISSTSENALETLRIVIEDLEKTGIAFKFCSDLKMLNMSLSKAWSRFQVGKFMTIYPMSVFECRLILDKLCSSLSHLTGPYIITDRPYNGSRVVYYRYGAHAGQYRVNDFGRSTPGFTLDDGSWYEDVRGAEFRMPPGCSDPFLKLSPDQSKQGPIILNDRYEIKGVIKFNATGGIYHGLDTRTQKRIVIREVRGSLGHLENNMPDDPAFILKREARILEKLASTGFAPDFVEIFKEWENWFLVEEYLEATSLWGHSMDFYYSNESQTSSFGLKKIISTIESIALALNAVHQAGVVLRDLTRNNIMFTNLDSSVKFIDFEFSYELDSLDPWLTAWTPGYASKEQIAAKRPTVEDDCYALGVLILDMLTFCASGLELDRVAILNKLKLVISDLKLPVQLCDLVFGLTNSDPQKRWSTKQVISYVKNMRAPEKETQMFPSREEMLLIASPTSELVDKIGNSERGLLGFLDSTLDLSRSDRLWPASPEIYYTNTVSIQYGAAGVAAFILRSRGLVSHAVLDWLYLHATSNTCPAGLYSGISGVALVFLLAGETDRAISLLHRASSHEISFGCSSLYFGSAGLGLVNLHFWLLLGDEKYLRAAGDLGDTLIGTAVEKEAGLCWPGNDAVYLGLGDGQSGIGLFLTYLAAATGEARYLQAGKRALMFDFSHSFRVAGRVIWKTHVGAKENSPNLPHTRFGSAGIGSACIRYFAVTGDVAFKSMALDCAHSVRTRISNKNWQDEGNSGYGEFFLDLAHFLNDSLFENIAYSHAESVITHGVQRPEGIAFAGAGHFRICCDYGSGGAGIGIFLNRLLNKKTRFLMPDEIFLKSKL